LSVEKCLLCRSSDTNFLFSGKASRKLRDFYRCESCKLIFVPQVFHLSPQEERELYDKHQNHIDNKGYLAHLKRMIKFIEQKFDLEKRKTMNVLDFGSGPNPVFANLLKELNFLEVSIYDPFYANDSLMLQRKYNLVTSVEVVEHFSNPQQSWQKLGSLVKSKGSLLLMTQMTDNVNSLKDWHYLRDATHVVFYCQETMAWIAQEFSLKVQRGEQDISFLKEAKNLL
jgi:hypothetical protein